MFFLGVLGAGVITYAIGFVVGRMMVVAVVVAVGIAVVLIDASTRHTENPALVAAVQLVCVGVIACCSALGVIAKRRRRYHTR